MGNTDQKCLSPIISYDFVATCVTTSVTTYVSPLFAMLAERGGFEPPIPLRVCLISSQVHSTGLCHLSNPYEYAYFESGAFNRLCHLSFN